ncbi:ribonuclease H-like protein [Xylariaceae sp. FL0804]|nr:ribonuclease H-like protein [Xylariaceae sp. FL0804]
MSSYWHHSRSFVPPGRSRRDDEERCRWSPDDRKIVGRPHGRVVCDECDLDLSFMDDPSFGEEFLSIYDDDKDLKENLQMFIARRSKFTPTYKPFFESPGKRSTGRVFPTRFTPPSRSTRPLQLFHGRPHHAGGITRYIHIHDPRAALVFTDGACSNNGHPNPRAGWAFQQPAVAAGRVELEGPYGDPAVQSSSNRAELRAVVAALGCRYWPGEGFRTLVIATDSEYVIRGATEWAKSWFTNGWQTANKKADVKNQDLWELLLAEVEDYYHDGMLVADAAAKNAAGTHEMPINCVPVIGMPLIGVPLTFNSAR